MAKFHDQSVDLLKQLRSQQIHIVCQFVEEGLDAALSRKKSSWLPPRTFDGVAEAKLIALACSEPPPGHARWTLKLFEKKVVELGIVEAASDTTIYRTLNKNEVKPLKSRYWVIPPEVCAAFVSAMERVLEVYARLHDLHDPARPLVCLDETSRQLIRETRIPLPHGPGREARVDYEYERAGAVNLFMLFAPLEGWREVSVRDRRIAFDYVHVLRELADVHFPSADKIILVQDNLNTHNEMSLYKTFPADEVRRIANRFEWHYPPHRESLRVALHPQTWVLAQYGRM